jgi:hypothetical protein
VHHPSGSRKAGVKPPARPPQSAGFLGLQGCSEGGCYRRPSSLPPTSSAEGTEARPLQRSVTRGREHQRWGRLVATGERLITIWTPACSVLRRGLVVLIEVNTCSQQSNPSVRVLVSSLLVGVLWLAGPQPAAACNSEEHKACTELAISKLDVDPAVVFWDATDAVFVPGDSATDRASSEEAKKLAVGFTTNGPDDYVAHTACQDNDYYSILPGCSDQMGTAGSVGSGNLWIWTLPEEVLATTWLEIPTSGHQGEPFTWASSLRSTATTARRGGVTTTATATWGIAKRKLQPRAQPSKVG